MTYSDEINNFNLSDIEIIGDTMENSGIKYRKVKIGYGIDKNFEKHFKELLSRCIRLGVSDIHLQPYNFIRLRNKGTLLQFPKLTGGEEIDAEYMINVLKIFDLAKEYAIAYIDDRYLDEKKSRELMNTFKSREEWTEYQQNLGFMFKNDDGIEVEDYIQEYNKQLNEKQNITKMLTTNVTINVQNNAETVQQVQKSYRLRINVGKSSGNYYATIRILSIDVPTFEELNLPTEYFESIASLKNGLIIVSGHMGNGKTTTVASALAKIAQNESFAIGTIEQPIEYIMPQNTKSLIIQREVGVDVKSFSEAIDHYLRDDLNVISVGELKSDADTALSTLQIAETGILTFTTIHGQSIPATVSRLLNIFDSSDVIKAQSMLLNSLACIINQKLIKVIGGKDEVVPLVEILYLNEDDRASLMDEALNDTNLFSVHRFKDFMKKIQEENQGTVSKKSSFWFTKLHCAQYLCEVKKIPIATFEPHLNRDEYEKLKEQIQESTFV
ncbi:ATPase, T2SS/T4P/T4SS family [Bacillus subtilis]|uniref:Type IV pili twitching motility protein n=2 Tax=Bacillus subtilis TaxID=1423 RepID=A0A0D1KDX3_BACIU|nr:MULTISPECIES: ATPase, T2SS/T4P/T4SS family [Bacillus subtilis group]AVB12079.1 hypothetical protein C3438_21700 [Bacillus velezensis]AYK76606.1 hypothetical protein D9C12_22955 [Bacillus subtilis subsp. subtilis]AYL03236.1 hypothetical protein D9C08_23110 [Bacillus subtilis subsp. subtilis]KIU04442.1 type IV pili twitching motility protein [Bacillus subtilis]MCB4339789.1 Twitching mobility protein [Bacillus subtilis]